MKNGFQFDGGIPFELSDGEVDFLWWFIQGSIMDPEVRARLYAHWGLCPRHSLGFFAIESAFRPHLIHGCTILYAELMRRASNVLNDRGIHSLIPHGVALHLLRESGPCHLCDLGYGPRSTASLPPDRNIQGHDLSVAKRFATDNEIGWRPYVCGVCTATSSEVLCREHLVEALTHGDSHQIKDQHRVVTTIGAHLANFENSFRWKLRGTDTSEDRGALISAIGWCSGWRVLMDGLEIH